MENSRNISENTIGKNAIVNQGDGNHITVNLDTSNADKSFLQEISKTDPVHDKKRILMFKGPLLWDSFSWIFGHQEFSNWRHTKQSGVFWIKGDPGKGKTMLLCGIIEDLEKDSQCENLSYFFCQATDYRINTAAAVVGGLIKSLLKRHPTLLTRIRKKYGDGPKGQLEGVNALAILCDIFETIVKDPALTDITCVIDALDECIKDCSHLLKLIVKTSDRIKWLLSSRNEKDIERGLERVRQRLVLELKQNAEQISLSIDAYIKHHIKQIGALEDDEQLQETTFNTLKDKAQGTFLWVALVVEQLHKTDRWEMEDVLEEVPKDLEDLYGLILDRSEKLGRKGREVCQVLLSIITTAKRPLHLGELLVFINSHWKDNKHFKTTYGIRDVRDMAKTCGSILSIREDFVYFIHQSAKDYVVENAAQRIFPILHQHYKMFETSIEAMTNVLKYDIYDLKDPGIHIDDVPPKDFSSDPLASIRYCCIFWIEHLVSGYQFGGFELAKHLKDDEKLHSFLKKKILCWIESLCLMRSFSPQAQIALQKLKDLIDCYCGNKRKDETFQATQLQRERETQSLRQFTSDACRFISHFQESVAYWPLQLYFSAMSFEQHNSAIRKTFERTVREKFGLSPTLASVQHGRSSFRLHSSFHVPKDISIGLELSNLMIFSPDSSLIGQMYFGSLPPLLGFWRADSGIMEYAFEINNTSKIAFFPDSNDFISVSQDGIMKSWSMDRESCIGGQCLSLEWNRHDSNLNSPEEKVIALSPKGDLVASLHLRSSDKSGRISLIKVWDTKTACCGSLFESSGAPDMYAAFSPNSQLLALLFADCIRIHNTKTGAIVHSFNSHHASDPFFWSNGKREDILGRILFSPNSKFLVIMVSELQFYLWDTQTWELLPNIQMSSRQLRCFAISPDSTILATSSYDGTKLWSIETGECVAKVPIFSLSIAFAPNWTKSSLVALQQESGMIHTWFINISETSTEVQHHDIVFDDVTISPNSRFVASRNRHRGEVNVWSGDDGQLVHILRGRIIEHKSSIEDLFFWPPLVFSPDSQLLAIPEAGHDGAGIQIWHVITGKSVCLLRRPYNGSFSSAAFSSDPKHLVAGDFGGVIYVWRIDSGQLLHIYDFDKSRETIENLMTSISPDSVHVAAFYHSESTYMKIWHLHMARNVVVKPPQKAWMDQFEDQILSLEEAQISFSSDSAILALVTESMAQIFDVTTGACLQSFTLDRNEHPRLLPFDPVNGQIHATNTVFYKTFSWKHWETSTRLGYSYDYRLDGPFGDRGVWILLNGKKNCYVPSTFRPRLLSLPSANVAMTDSLLAVVNELGEVVIIKFPTRCEGRQQAIGGSDFRPVVGGITGNITNSHLVAHASTTGKSESRSPKRKRGASNESSVGGHTDSSFKSKMNNKKGKPLNGDG